MRQCILLSMLSCACVANAAYSESDGKKPYRVLDDHLSRVRDIAISPDGKTLVSASEDQTVKFWALTTKKEITTSVKVNPLFPTSLCFDKDGEHLAVGFEEGQIQLWESKTLKDIYTLNHDNMDVTSIAFSPDDKLLVSAAEGSGVKVWEVASGKQLYNIKVFRTAFSMAFSPDGKILAAGGGLLDKSVLLWNVKTKKKIALLPGHMGMITSLAFTPDGKQLVVGSRWLTSKPGEVYIWDVAKQKRVKVLKGFKGGIRKLAVSKDGKLVAVASVQLGVGEIKLYDLKSYSEICTVFQGERLIHSVQFVPNGKALAAAISMEIKLWHVPDLLKKKN